MSAVIDVNNLVNEFSGHKVHDGLNLTVDQGEVIAIIGNSGSGKTTLLRSILMLNKPKSGNISVFGCDIFQCSASYARRVRQSWGIMFQSGALFGSLTVLENVMFPLIQFTHLGQDKIKQIALFRILTSGLSLQAVHQYPSDLSGGMRKRAAMARAIAMEPQLLFLDEPTAGLDPHSAEGLDDLMLYLNQQLGLTIVMVTHDLDTLWHVPNRVVFLGEGQVLASGAIDWLSHQDHPQIQSYFKGYRARKRIGKKE